MRQAFTVKGMHCRACAVLVTEALEDDGATDVKVALDEKTQTGSVTLDSDSSREDLAAIIEDQGTYTVE